MFLSVDFCLCSVLTVGSFISKLHRSPSWSDSNSTVDSQSSSHSTSRATSPTSDNGGGHSLGNNRQSAPAFLGNAGHAGSQVYSDHGAGQTGEWPGSRSWSSTFSTSGFHGLKKMETSQAELSDRFKKVIVTAVEFVLFSGKSAGFYLVILCTYWLNVCSLVASVWMCVRRLNVCVVCWLVCVCVFRQQHKPLFSSCFFYSNQSREKAPQHTTKDDFPSW